ncbi:helix-turn-helix transcriptional regulator [Chitinivibrio alkaliphilus]|nr:helix-turn-helix transcriptional regulator [Chitinivibrio alkaliphilus]
MKKRQRVYVQIFFISLIAGTVVYALFLPASLSVFPERDPFFEYSVSSDSGTRVVLDSLIGADGDRQTVFRYHSPFVHRAMDLSCYSYLEIDIHPYSEEFTLCLSSMIDSVSYHGKLDTHMPREYSFESSLKGRVRIPINDFAVPRRWFAQRDASWYGTQDISKVSNITIRGERFFIRSIRFIPSKRAALTGAITTFIGIFILLVTVYTQMRLYKNRKIKARIYGSKSTLSRGLDVSEKHASKKVLPDEVFPEKHEQRISVAAYIDIHFTSSELRRAAVAEKLGYTIAELTTALREERGMTYKEYVTHLRISKARELLRTTEYPISRISFLTGHQYANSFSRTFKNCEGISPQEYRNRYGLRRDNKKVEQSLGKIVSC